MLEGSSRPLNFKVDKIIVPMAKGQRSRKALRLAMDFSDVYNSEITAFTVKDSSRELTWSDKVHVVTSAYKLGRERNIRVVPKVTSNKSVKTGIVEETKLKNYDLLLMASESRSFFSKKLFGGMVDYVIRNSKIPVAALSIKSPNYPYSSIAFPMSEKVNTKASLAFALSLKKVSGKALNVYDFRFADSAPAHGFRVLNDHFNGIVETYGGDINLIRVSENTEIKDFMMNELKKEKNPLFVMGIRADQNGKVKIPGEIREMESVLPSDTIIVKR